ncbi:hypothetical protein AB1Y20_008304 [Prymnesium parvum]|uniref:Uncharacterized protein n=1 Tax=Prymnesium parvum TaxID=97485 RepID=A0AB34IWP3_PRYPA
MAGGALSARLGCADSCAVVTGASRGIGLALTAELLRRSRGTVVAASRQPHLSAPLRELSEDFPSRLSLLPCDVLRPASLEAMAARLAASHARVDLVLNVAGVLHDGGRVPEKSLAAVDAEWMAHVYRVNAVGPVLVAQATQPLLRPGSVVASVSARVGSIGDNHLGGWWSYRMSKAALNMATRNLAIELKRSGAIAVSLHPGTTDTDLSKPFQRNVRPEKLFTPEFTARSLLDVLEGLTLEDTGGFFAYNGERIEW